MKFFEDPVFDRGAPDHMLLHDALDPIGADAAVGDALRPDQQDRSPRAHPQAVGLGAQHHSLRPGRILQAKLPH